MNPITEIEESKHYIKKIENEWIDWCFTHAGMIASNDDIGKWFVKKIESSLAPIIDKLKRENKNIKKSESVFKNICEGYQKDLEESRQRNKILLESCDQKDEAIRQSNEVWRKNNDIITANYKEIEKLKEDVRRWEGEALGYKHHRDILLSNKEKKEEPNNIIPEMTHPLGKGWSGPDRNEIQIDHQYARMSKSTFNRLRHVQGSGALRMVYEGKMWKTSDDEIHWQLHWWSASDDPNKCKGNVRDIIVREDEKK